MKKLLTILFLSISAIKGVSAQTPTEKQSCNLSKSGLAIDGYDPVAYFTTGKPVEGKKEYALTVDGISYQFSTPQNKELFRANPTRYKPQYGGWCAYAMGASGEKVDVDPETFKIINGKLYLFYNKFFNNTLKSWNKDETGLKTKADANWVKTNH
ncbi:MAG TPA: YHS domain-containing (seleno)protein [Puia sp.]|jgi:YHS domain-containing protein